MKMEDFINKIVGLQRAIPKNIISVERNEVGFVLCITSGYSTESPKGRYLIRNDEHLDSLIDALIKEDK